MIEFIKTQPLAVSFLFSFAINFLFFLIAFTFRTDKVTDLSYSLSFAVIAPLLLFTAGPGYSLVQFLTMAAVFLWAFRLGSYLLIRIIVTKTDERFDDKRNNPANLIKFWVLQMVAVWVIMLPFSLSLTSRGGEYPEIFTLVGFLVYAIGFLIETISDFQKFFFKKKPENRGLWMERGLWKYSRHPNYFGEILVWWGLFIVVLPSLSSMAYLTVLGPLFITFLLLFVSGIPLLEKSANSKYGSDPQYINYKERTNLLIPGVPRKS